MLGERLGIPPDAQLCHQASSAWCGPSGGRFAAQPFVAACTLSKERPHALEAKLEMPARHVSTELAAHSWEERAVRRCSHVCALKLFCGDLSVRPPGMTSSVKHMLRLRALCLQVTITTTKGRAFRTLHHKNTLPSTSTPSISSAKKPCCAPHNHLAHIARRNVKSAAFADSAAVPAAKRACGQEEPVALWAAPLA